MASKVIHITDFHLYGDSELAAWGAWGDVRPYSALEAVLVLAKSKVPDAEAILLTGDFTHDDTLASYVSARDVIRKHFPSVPLLYTPGNHDTEMETLTKAFTREDGFVGPSATDPVALTTLGKWRIVLLNSSVKGAMHGELSEESLRRVGDALAAADADGAPALVALHHPPIPPAGAQPPWGVAHPRWGYPCLRDPAPSTAAAAAATTTTATNASADASADGKDAPAPGSRFLGVLASHPSARVVVHGHLHADVAHRVGHTDLYGSPSTCHQIATAAPTWTLVTDVTPGYRLLELHPDGTHSTAVVRLPALALEPCRAPEPHTPQPGGVEDAAAG